MPQNNKVAIVTGASAGIGQASAKALHQAGFRVFGTSRRAAESVSERIAMITCDRPASVRCIRSAASSNRSDSWRS
jgi:NAD(P)-dependent dehydrogenase (short-subunit alcohol dehydrogenase family)